MAISTSLLIVGTPFQQIFVDPTTREPMIGSVYFYVTGTTTLKNVYIASGDPTDPYVASSNPITLDAAGALTSPILYYPYDESDNETEQLYDVIVKDDNGVTQVSITGWPYSQQISSSSSSTDSEYIPGGQFPYPLQFYLNGTAGLLTQSMTGVAVGWQYWTNADLTATTRRVTFSNIANEGIDGDPIHEINIISSSVSANETYSTLTSLTLGPCNLLEGQNITVSLQAYASSGTNEVILQIVRYYGNPQEGASSEDTEDIAILTLTSTRTQYTENYTVPSLSGKTIVGSGDFFFQISLPTQATYSLHFTNISLKVGTLSKPVYASQNGSLVNAKLVGQTIPLVNPATKIGNLGVYQDYSYLQYLEGQFIPKSLTGTYALVDINAVTPNMVVLTDVNQTLPVNGANADGVPYYNLYQILGTKWGTGGNLSVSSNEAVVTFTSNIGARVHSTPTVGTTNFTYNLVNIGLDYGLSAEVTGSNTVEITSYDNYAANTANAELNFVAAESGGASYQVTLKNNYLTTNPVCSNTFSTDYYYEYSSTTTSSSIHFQPAGEITSVTNQVGSSVAPWKVTLTFNRSDITAYKSYSYNTTTSPASGGLFYRYNVQNRIWFNHLQFPTLSDNTKGTLGWSYWTYGSSTYIAGSQTPTNGPVVIAFRVDGEVTDYYNYNDFTPIFVDFDSSKTLAQNLNLFVDALNIPFEYKFTVTNTITGGQYILYSSSDTDYYAWFKVDGVGTNPSISGRTGVEVDVLSTDTATQIATKLAAAVNSFTFSLPTYEQVGYTSAVADNTNSVAIVYL